MPLRYPVPESDKEFEDLCVGLLSRHWNTNSLHRYGTPGQSQHGVDIYDSQGSTPFRAAQCKLRETHLVLSAEELRSEVNKAENFTPKLDHYAIVTTAKIPTKTAQELIAINREHSNAGLFSVEILRYDELVEKYSEVLRPLLSPILGPSNIEISELSVKIDTLISATSPTDQDIEEGKSAVKAHDYQSGRFQLSRIKSRKWNQLTDLQKYDVTANLAICELVDNHFETAADLFLEALPYKPADEKARANAAFAYQLRGLRVQAFRAASGVRETFPESARAAAIWIQNAPPERSAKELAESLGPAVLDDAEVNVALGRRAADDGDLDVACQYADKATKAKPEWSFTWLLLGQILMQRETRTGLHLDPKLRSPELINQLRRVEEIFTAAVESATLDREASAKAIALVMRSSVRSLLGDLGGMRKDIEEANKEEPDRFEVKRSYAESLFYNGETAKAVEILRTIPSEHHDNGSRYLLSLALGKTNQEADRIAALDLLKTIITDKSEYAPVGFRSQAFLFALSLMRKEQADVARLWLADSVDLDPIERAAVEGRISLLEDDRAAAIRVANDACSLVLSDSLPSSMVRLAELLSDINLFEEAFSLWERVTRNEAPESWHRRFLEAAFNTKRHGLFLERCEYLRKRGISDPNLLQAELDVLEKYDLEASIRILRNYVSLHPDNREARLRLSVFGYRLNRKELINASPELMPEVESVRPDLGFTAVQIQKLCGNPDVAVEYAYRLSQLHPRDPNAQRALLAVLHPFGPQPKIQEISEAKVDAAVAFLEEGSAEPHWAIIEEEVSPTDSESIPPTHSLSKKLLGHRIGDEIELAERAVQSRKAVIVDVKSKFVHRYQRILRDWQILFPDEPDVQLVRVKNDAGEYDFSAVKDAIEARNRKIREIVSFYKTTPIPLYILSKGLGVSVLEFVEFLSGNPDTQIRCCVGNLPERQQALEALATATEIVLDLSALSTLVILNRLDLLKKSTKRIIVAQDTLNALLRLLLDQTGSANVESGYVVKEGAALAFAQVTVEQKLARAGRISEVVSFISQNCEVRGCRELASLEPARRQELEKSFGLAGAQTIVIASRPGAVLWADDLPLAVYAGTQGAKRAWTQVVFQYLENARRLSPDESATLSARLVAMGYEFSYVNERICMAAVQMAGGDATMPPLEAVLMQFGRDSIEAAGLLRISALFLAELEKKQGKAPTTRRIIQYALSFLASRRDGLTLVRVLSRDLRGFLSFQLGRKSEVVYPTFCEWLSFRFAFLKRPPQF